MEDEKGLTVTESQILFKEYPTGEIWFDCITSSFEILISEIKVVAISPRLALDEEIFMISLIDKDQNFYEFSSWECQKESFKQFEEKFELNDIVTKEWSKFSWRQHQDYITSKVLYPAELYWEDLFERPKSYLKFIERIMKVLSIKKPISGKLNSAVEKHLSE